ncbi:MAG: hypothetical protein ACE5I3_06415 [Phycisphaerae bacterium]
MRKPRAAWRNLQSHVVLLVLAAPASGNEIVVRNDSFEDGGPAVIVGNFIPGEHAGARLTAPCDGAIVAVQIAWLEGTPGHDPTVERAIHIFEGSTFPTPGTELALLEAPVMTPGFFNEFRYLDEGQTTPLNIPVTAGQPFYVTLEFDNPTDVGNGGPSVVRDVDGCQPGANVLYAIPGGWLNFCIYLQGDLLIRAVIDCDEMSGACCLPDGACETMTPSDCVAAGGLYQGDGSDCAAVDCPQPEQACCFEATGGCLDLTEEDCLIAGGIPGGDGTDCATYVCFPIGACCLPDGTCLDDLSPEDCEALDGVFQGDGTTCDGSACPEPSGACCFVTGGCLVLTESDCAIAGGTWVGPATDCSDGDGNGTADACETSPCLGDLDGDQEVNLTDLAMLLASYGVPNCDPDPCPGDFDGDGDVDLADLAALLANYGQVCP